MIRIERFKQLLRERIAEYQASYDASKSQMMFGALQEAKDTLEYIEKQFPSILGEISFEPQKVKVTVEVEKLKPQEAQSMRKVATMRELPGGALRRDEHIMEEYKYWIIESFFQFLVAERDSAIHWKESDDGTVVATMLIVPQQ